MGSNNLQSIEQIDASIQLTEQTLGMWEGKVVREGSLGVVWRNGKFELLGPGKNVPRGFMDAVKRKEVIVAIVDMRPGRKLPVSSNEEFRLIDGMYFSYEVQIVFKVIDPARFVSYINPLSSIATMVRDRIQRIVQSREVSSESLLTGWIPIQDSLSNSEDLIGDALDTTGIGITRLDIISFSPDKDYSGIHKDNIIDDKDNRDKLKNWEIHQTLQINQQRLANLLELMQIDVDAGKIRILGQAENEVYSKRIDLDTESRIKLLEVERETQALLENIRSNKEIEVARYGGLSNILGNIVSSSLPGRVNKNVKEILDLMNTLGGNQAKNSSPIGELSSPVNEEQRSEDPLEIKLRGKLAKNFGRKEVTKSGKTIYRFNLKVNNTTREAKLIINTKKMAKLQVQLGNWLEKEVNLDFIEGTLDMAKDADFWKGAEVVPTKK